MPNLLETILTHSKPAKPEKVHVAAWKVDVFVKRMNAGELVKLKSGITEFNKGEADFEMLRCCVCDEDGKPVFQSVDQVKSIGPKPFDFLVGEVLRVNGLLGDVDEKKD